MLSSSFDLPVAGGIRPVTGASSLHRQTWPSWTVELPAQPSNSRV